MMTAFCFLLYFAVKTEILQEEEVVLYTIHGKPITVKKRFQNHLVIDTAPQVICARDIPEIVARRGGRDVDEEQPMPWQTPTSGSKTAAAPRPPTEHVVNIWNWT